MIHGTPVRYIGAMGSRRTAAARRVRLIDAGWAEDEVDRIHGPVGIDLGGESPGEVALSILAEMTAVRYGVGVEPELTGVVQRLGRNEG